MFAFAAGGSTSNNLRSPMLSTDALSAMHETQEEMMFDSECTQAEFPESAAMDEVDDTPQPWGRLICLQEGVAHTNLMPREEKDGRPLNEKVLGRSKDMPAVKDPRISARHCRIFCVRSTSSLGSGAMEVYVEDMSVNGTWINSECRLRTNQKRLLNSGDEISLCNPKKRISNDRDAGAVSFTFVLLNRSRYTQSGSRSNIALSSNGGNHGAGGHRGGGGGGGESSGGDEGAGFAFGKVASGAGRGGRSPGGVLGHGHGNGAQNGGAPALRSATLTAGNVHDDYDVRQMIGHGQCGEVRLAIHRRTGKQVAVKEIQTRRFKMTPGLSATELVQEAEMLRAVMHPYIIQLEDIYMTDTALFLVMELVEGGDLFDRIVEKGVYPEPVARELLFRVLTAVAYLHGKDIVHRDLKPENILLVSREDDVDVKITDFGLAKRANKDGLKTFCGTPQYFAPEVLRRRNTVQGAGRYGKEADMWSLGVILYILLSGTHPFHDDTLFEQIQGAFYNFDGPEWAAVSDCGRDLVAKLLVIDPQRRLSAEQALAHPFVAARPGAGTASDAAAAAAAATAAAAGSGAAEAAAAADGGSSGNDEAAAPMDVCGAAGGGKTGPERSGSGTTARSSSSSGDDGVEGHQSASAAGAVETAAEPAWAAAVAPAAAAGGGRRAGGKARGAVSDTASDRSAAVRTSDAAAAAEAMGAAAKGSAPCGSAGGAASGAAAGSSAEAAGGGGQKGGKGTSRARGKRAAAEAAPRVPQLPLFTGGAGGTDVEMPPPTAEPSTAMLMPPLPRSKSSASAAAQRAAVPSTAAERLVRMGTRGGAGAFGGGVWQPAELVNAARMDPPPPRTPGGRRAADCNADDIDEYSSDESPAKPRALPGATAGVTAATAAAGSSNGSGSRKCGGGGRKGKVSARAAAVERAGWAKTPSAKPLARSGAASTEGGTADVGCGVASSAQLRLAAVSAATEDDAFGRDFAEGCSMGQREELPATVARVSAVAGAAAAVIGTTAAAAIGEPAKAAAAGGATAKPVVAASATVNEPADGNESFAVFTTAPAAGGSGSDATTARSNSAAAAAAVAVGTDAGAAPSSAEGVGKRRGTEIGDDVAAAAASRPQKRGKAEGWTGLKQRTISSFFKGR